MGEGADVVAASVVAVSDSEPRQSSSDFGSLLADRWLQLSPLVDAVLDAPRDRRSSVLTEVSGATRSFGTKSSGSSTNASARCLCWTGPRRGVFAFARRDPDAAIPEMLGGRYRIEREVGRVGWRASISREISSTRGPSR
jgi:hypothetical protein